MDGSRMETGHMGDAAPNDPNLSSAGSETGPDIPAALSQPSQKAMNRFKKKHELIRDTEGPEDRLLRRGTLKEVARAQLHWGMENTSVRHAERRVGGESSFIRPLYVHEQAMLFLYRQMGRCTFFRLV